MNYQLFDPSFNQRYTGHVQVTKAAAITKENPNAEHKELQMEVIVDEPGYMFTYLSHEEETNTVYLGKEYLEKLGVYDFWYGNEALIW